MKNTKGQAYSEPDVGMRFTAKNSNVCAQTTFIVAFKYGASFDIQKIVHAILVLTSVKRTKDPVLMNKIEEVVTVSQWSFAIHYNHFICLLGPRQANLVLITYASSEGSGEPAHPGSLARTSAARSYRQ